MSLRHKQAPVAALGGLKSQPSQEPVVIEDDAHPHPKASANPARRSDDCLSSASLAGLQPCTPKVRQDLVLQGTEGLGNSWAKVGFFLIWINSWEPPYPKPPTAGRGLHAGQHPQPRFASTRSGSLRRDWRDGAKGERGLNTGPVPALLASIQSAGSSSFNLISRYA